MNDRNDTDTRLRMTTARHLAVGLDAGFDPAIRTEVARLASGWLQLQPGRVVRDRVGRLRLSPPSVATLRGLALTLRWMADARHHHGQQAGETAAKVLRGLRERRLPFDELLAQSEHFRSQRHGHIRTNAITRRHAPATTIDLADGARAVRIGTVEELRLLGRLFGNCLHEAVMARFHAQALRDNETEFWRVDGAGADKAPLWCLSVSRESGRVEEIEHVRDAGTAFPDRSLLVEFLRARGARIDDESRAGAILRPLGITEAMIAGGSAQMARAA